jgi:large subunit ribosomal protein L31
VCSEGYWAHRVEKKLFRTGDKALYNTCFFSHNYLYRKTLQQVAIDTVFLGVIVKKNLHPEIERISISCACGNQLRAFSTKKDVSVTLCGKCHPFYTGAQKFVDTAGRIEKFNKKFSKKA